MPYSALSVWVLPLLPTILLLLAALVAVAPVRYLVSKLLGGKDAVLPEWMRILLDAFRRPASLAVRAFFLLLALYFLPVAFNDAAYKAILGKCAAVIYAALITWGCWNSAPLCRLLLRSAENRLDMETNQTMGRFFENIFRALIAILGGIVILDLLGVPVTGLLTGAGVAGLAVSLAAQSTLSNLIAGITLVVEHPFGIGDYVVLGSYEGTVEDVSFRSTKLRTPDNVVITVENSKVCAEYIQNVTNRTSRLWQFSIALTYDTTQEQLEALSADLKALLENDPSVTGSVIVGLAEFANSSMNITVRCYVDTLALADFYQLKNRLNLAIMQLMKKHGCAFALPASSVYLEQND